MLPNVREDGSAAVHAIGISASFDKTYIVKKTDSWKVLQIPSMMKLCWWGVLRRGVRRQKTIQLKITGL